METHQVAEKSGSPGRARANLVWAAAIAAGLAGCAGPAEPLSIPIAPAAGDQRVMGEIEVLTCDQIEAEYKANTALAAAWSGTANGNDPQDLVDRNAWLRQLAQVKDCDTAAYPPPLDGAIWTEN